MAPTEGGRSNREEMRESPPAIKGPLREGAVVVTVPGGTEGVERKSGFSQKVMLVVLVVLSVSHLMLWVQVTYGGGCPHNNQLSPPPSSYLPSSSPSSSYQSHNKDSKSKVIADSANEVVERERREIDDPLPLYITVDQYAEDRAALQTQMTEMIKHPSVRLVLNGYIPTHEIDNQNSLQWAGVTAQSLFNLTESGRDLRVATSGYHHISLTVMFSGRTSINRLPSCSIKVASKFGDTNNYRHTTLLFVSRTQNQMGLRIGAFYPIDTAHASGNFLLRRGDVIIVRPGTWSLGCQIHTEPYKTHLDAMLISKTGD